jgi:hypothetical protein
MKVEITLDPFGRPSIKGVGFTGEGCKAHLANFAKAAGGEQTITDTEDMLAIETETNEKETEYGY